MVNNNLEGWRETENLSGKRKRGRPTINENVNTDETEQKYFKIKTGTIAQYGRQKRLIPRIKLSYQIKKI